MIAVELKDVWKRYPMGKESVDALAGVSLSIEEGEYVAIIGQSGAGKSTLLHILGGIDTFDQGEVTIGGVSLNHITKKELACFRRRQIGLIYQFYNLVPVLTVQENITLPVRLDNAKVDPVKLSEMLEQVGLSDRKQHFSNQLSGGQQQRTAIARALYSNPSVILADEPTGNLDSVNSKEIMNLFTEVNRQYKKTIVLVTHDLEVAHYADRIITMKDGRIVCDECSHGNAKGGSHDN